MVKKYHRDEKFKAKLNLAFFILYTFDPYIFYNVKGSPQRNNKNKSYLLDKLKRIKFFLKKLSTTLIYQRKFLKGEIFLKLKPFLTNFANKKFLRVDKTIYRLTKNRRDKNFFFLMESTDIEETIKVLEDFLAL